MAKTKKKSQAGTPYQDAEGPTYPTSGKRGAFDDTKETRKPLHTKGKKFRTTGLGRIDVGPKEKGGKTDPKESKSKSTPKAKTGRDTDAARKTQWGLDPTSKNQAVDPYFSHINMPQFSPLAYQMYFQQTVAPQLQGVVNQMDQINKQYASDMNSAMSMPYMKADPVARAMLAQVPSQQAHMGEVARAFQGAALAGPAYDMLMRNVGQAAALNTANTHSYLTTLGQLQAQVANPAGSAADPLTQALLGLEQNKTNAPQQQTSGQTPDLSAAFRTAIGGAGS